LIRLESSFFVLKDGLIFLAAVNQKHFMNVWARVVLVVAALCLPDYLFAQEKADTVQGDTTRRNIINTIKESRVSRRLLKSITRKRPTNPTAAVRSEDAFMPFEGKIIRRIEVRHIGFDKTVYDTTKNIKNTVIRVSNALHSNSRDWLIRDHLFIRPNRPLNPYKVADNERYLRDLDFILDSKIYVVPLHSSTDSVDIVVLTRDVFSLGGSLSPSGPSRTRFRLYDVNLFGMGQRLQFNGLYDEDRNPSFGHEFLYRKNSVAGTFVDATVGYTQLNTGSSYGEEEEKSYYLRLNRPLVSPYTKFAGGMEISRNWSENLFNVTDTIFRDYSYIVNDVWMGYNIGANNNSRDRSRHFLAIRAFEQFFSRQPLQTLERNLITYNNRSYVLGGITFFKQNFYTASYIYGFGRTEDVPYGHNASIYLGWSRELGRQRPYVGLEFEKSVVSRSNEFYNFAVRAGGYKNKGRVEDVALLVSGSLNSKLIPVGQLLIRQLVSADYTRIYRQRTNLPLDINNEFGLRYFVADSLNGTKRFHLLSETVAFTPLTIAGFRFAPFTVAEMAMINPKGRSIFGEKPFFGFGGGIRTRNENLVFGTIELRLVYFPRTVEEISSFAVRLSSNLRVKYTAGFVKPPSFITYN
jgi:hypothetical protein